jgi:hypothetical protein
VRGDQAHHRLVDPPPVARGADGEQGEDRREAEHEDRERDDDFEQGKPFARGASPLALFLPLPVNSALEFRCVSFKLHAPGIKLGSKL